MAILAHNGHVTYRGVGTMLALRNTADLLTNILCGIFQKLTKNYSDLLLTMSFFTCTIRTIDEISIAFLYEQ